MTVKLSDGDETAQHVQCRCIQGWFRGVAAILHVDRTLHSMKASSNFPSPRALVVALNNGWTYGECYIVAIPIGFLLLAAPMQL